MIDAQALDAIAGLWPVGLDELNAQAQLQTRVDRKYILPASHVPSILSALPLGTRVLKVSGEAALRYRSDYFDTSALDSYLGAARGRRRRFKVRSRSYLDSGGAFLEVKTRGGRSTTVKDRVAVAPGPLDAPAIAHTAQLLGDAGIPDADRLARDLRPALQTRYRRVTLLLPAEAEPSDASRATLDVDLEWRDPHGEGFRLPRVVVIETKSGQRAGDVDRALWRCGHRPSTLSKYGTGLAALRPDLPSNKWRRVLDRHFVAPSPLPATAPLSAAPMRPELPLARPLQRRAV